MILWLLYYTCIILIVLGLFAIVFVRYLMLPGFIKTKGPFPCLPKTRWEIQKTKIRHVEFIDTHPYDKENRPIIYYLPGLWTCLSLQTPFIQLLVEHGFRVICLEYRQHAQATRRTRVEDIETVWQDYIVSKRRIASLRLVTISYGGTLAAYWLTKYNRHEELNTRIRQWMCFHPVHNLQDTFRARLSPYHLSDFAPETNDNLLSLLQFLPKDTPLIIVHCEGDPTIGTKDSWSSLSKKSRQIIWLENRSNLEDMDIHIKSRFEDTDNWIPLLLN